MTSSDYYIKEAINALGKESKDSPSRHKSLAMTKLQEARMWLSEETDKYYEPAEQNP